MKLIIKLVALSRELRKTDLSELIDDGMCQRAGRSKKPPETMKTRRLRGSTTGSCYRLRGVGTPKDTTARDRDPRVYTRSCIYSPK
ncbi:hypothetical protein J6590_050313 [Homalodisca vitripennis]|nr:hypothetical protein J6590_050313 [Homalodisca vitripennis]